MGYMGVQVLNIRNNGIAEHWRPPIEDRCVDNDTRSA